ncbi:uncharacterized protein LOC136025163 isoform X3 [Artemia franciscana]|uniref:uncharacterized protein LOC136025163 isoform X3 n=1 Tax=Artemia franciscana TaxID=6661 RepID=UPI0032DAFA8A
MFCKLNKPAGKVDSTMGLVSGLKNIYYNRCHEVFVRILATVPNRKRNPIHSTTVNHSYLKVLERTFLLENDNQNHRHAIKVMEIECWSVRTCWKMIIKTTVMPLKSWKLKTSMKNQININACLWSEEHLF